MLESITYKNIPCWYELSWDEKIPAIILRIHKEFIKNLHIDLQNHYMAKSLMEKFKFSEFASDFSGDIGFNKVFKYQGEKDNFIEFLIEMPSAKKTVSGTCFFCKGLGKDSKKKCFSCNGTGKEFTRDWSQAYAVSASFTFFSALLHFPEKETSASFFQLMTIQTVTAREMHGGSLSGEISIPFKQWLIFLSDDEEEVDIPEVNNAMQIAYKAMFELTDYEKHLFYAYKNGKGNFITSCPGDACGLNPTYGYDYEGKGSKFSCHNVDTPLQQITLLVGLIKLYELAKKAIGK